MKTETSVQPIVFETSHRAQFSDLDPYNHVSTGTYATYFINHRMEGLRDHIGWDLRYLEKAPFMTWVRRIEIDYIRPLQGDQEFKITSYVREFQGSDAIIEGNLICSEGRVLARCVMAVAYVEKSSHHSLDWPQNLIDLFYE